MSGMKNLLSFTPVASRLAFITVAVAVAGCGSDDSGGSPQPDGGGSDSAADVTTGRDGAGGEDGGHGPDSTTPGDDAAPPADGPSPAETGPGEAGPGEAGPGEAGPGEAGPGEAGPGEAGPGDAGPVEAGPVEAGPVEAGPVEAGPGEAGPGEAGPGEAGAGEAGAGDGGDAGETNPPPVCAAVCPAGQKSCGHVCVSVDDPQYGCSPTSCSPCVGTSGTYESASCVAGACAFGTCPPGRADCDRNASNGCEADLGAPATCGSCGNACAPGQLCESGQCVTACTFPHVDCSGACRDTTSDPQACGGCGDVCPTSLGTPSCTSGKCAIACNAGSTSCSTGSSSPPACFYTGNGATAYCGSSCTPMPTYRDRFTPAFATYECAGGAATCSCMTGFTMCGTCSLPPYAALPTWSCVDTMTDPANCNGCGKACGAGETCQAGQCVAETQVQMVTGLTAVSDIAVDATNLYFADKGANTVWQVNKATLAKVQLGGSNEGAPGPLAVDDTTVYWSSGMGGAIRAAPIGGGAPARVLYSASFPGGIAVDANYVYWSDNGTNRLLRAPKNADAGAPVPLIPDGQAGSSRLRLDSHRLYGDALQYKNVLQRAIFGMDLASGTVDLYAIGVQGPFDVSPDRVYWYFTEPAGGDNDYVGWGDKLADVNGTPTDQIDVFVYAQEFVVDDCHAYLGASGGLWVLGRDGSERMLYSGGTVDHIAVDDQYVYFSEKTWIGRVKK
jgi:hypothetical protein